MFEFITDPEERGQVGIGTLIVFIAMVLVAAIAAGVLINTAGFLQTKSQATGQQSAAQVSNRIQVVSAYGHVNTAGNDNITNDTIDYINISIMRSAGSDNINVAKATINWIGPERATTLTYNTTAANATQFHSESIKGGPTVLDSKDTRIKLVINAPKVINNVNNFTATPGNVYSGLKEGQHVELTITTQYGSKTPVLLQAPESLTGKQAVKLA